MAILVKCASCGKSLSAPDAYAGKRVKCPGCGQVVLVPQAVPTAQQSPAAAPAPAGDPQGIRDAEPVPSGPASASLTPGGESRRPCPQCGELIIVGAAKCRYCNAIFDPTVALFGQPRGGGNREELRQLASYQRGIMYSILGEAAGYFLAIGLGAARMPILAPIAGLIFLAGFVAGLVYAILVSTKVYSTVTTVLLAILLFVPCLGLLVLLVINQAATKKLTQAGIKVGFLGASSSQF
jgi:predicted RNA-binding Zn-ribbon protein involved in translation (DUF1610 family)